MSLGKNDDVPPPPAKGEYHIKFANRQAAVGWRQLMQQIPANTNTAWHLMRKTPSPAVETDRHHRITTRCRPSTGHARAASGPSAFAGRQQEHRRVDEQSSAMPLPPVCPAGSARRLSPAAQPGGLRQTEMCRGESSVNGEPSQSATRRSSSRPAMRAIRSSSAGQAYRWREAPRR